MKVEVKSFKCIVCGQTSDQKYFTPENQDKMTLEQKVSELKEIISYIPLQKCPYCNYINVDIEKPVLTDIISIVKTPDYIAHTEEDLDPETLYFDYLENAEAATPETYAILASKAGFLRQAAISLYDASERLHDALNDFERDFEGEQLDDTDKEFEKALEERISGDLKLSERFIEKHLEENPEDYIAKCSQLNILKAAHKKITPKMTEIYNILSKDEFIPAEVKIVAKEIVTPAKLPE